MNFIIFVLTFIKNCEEMSKIVYILSQIPELAKLTTKALPDFQVIDIQLRRESKTNSINFFLEFIELLFFHSFIQLIIYEIND